MREECRSLQLGEVRRSQLGWLAGWMQRIGQQQKPIDQAWRFRRQHAALASAVRNPTQPDLIGMLLSDLVDFVPQAFAITRRITGARRAFWTILPEREIVTHHFDLMFGKCVGKSNQQGRVAIRSSAMSEQQVGHVEMEKGRLLRTASSTLTKIPG